MSAMFGARVEAIDLDRLLRHVGDIIVSLTPDKEGHSEINKKLTVYRSKDKDYFSVIIRDGSNFEEADVTFSTYTHKTRLELRGHVVPSTEIFYEVIKELLRHEGEIF